MRLMNVLKSAAQGYGTERRIILLHGPVGSAKSTIARQLKKGIEEYSRTAEGALYTYYWTLPGALQRARRRQRDVPLADARRAAAADPARVARGRRSTSSASATTTSSVKIEGDVNPACRLIFKELMRHYGGNFEKVMTHVQGAPPRALASRTASASARSSPRTRRTRTRPSSPATSTTARSPTFGSDSDPRAFNFDGEFNIANRGILEFVEILKLDVAFLYDLLGATQERKIKPKKFAQTDIDEVIIGHTNEAEYKKLLNNEFMEALRDRTVKVDIPYITKVSRGGEDLHEGLHARERVGKHIAPHTLYVAALWAVLTRLEDPKKHILSLLQKAKLYDGKTLPGFTAGQHQGAAQGGAARGPRRHLAALHPGQDRERARQRQGATARSTRSWCSTSSRAACAATR